jgi:hypothetical protein
VGHLGRDSVPEEHASEPHTLVVSAWNAGFFSHVNRVVNHLHHSLGRNGCKAIRVDWRVGEEIPLFIYGTERDGELWRHFFEPLDFPEAPLLERFTREYADLSMTGLHAYRMYKRGDGWRVAYGRAFDEHVRVREGIRRRVLEVWKDGGDPRRAIGVHYRHPGHDHECPRASPPLEVFIDRTRKLLARDGSTAVVLATDVHEALEAFRAEFGERLVVQPCVVRAGMEENQDDYGAIPSVELGEQALIDVLLLARCDALLHVVSNIATAVGYINPRLRMVYCEPRLLGAAATLRARLTPRPRATLEGVSRPFGVG